MSTIFPTTVPAKRLSESITGASSSFKVNNIEGWDGSNLTSADFGTKAYAVFRNSAGTLMEIMEIDPATIASASITILLRGLKFTGDLTTEVSGNKLTWVKGDTIVEFGTHVPQLLKHYVDDIADQSIAGIKTFSSFPKKSGVTTPTDASELATKAYVDLTATGTAVYNKQLDSGTSGEALTAGQEVYFKTSDQKWWRTDADAAATALGVKIGIVQTTVLSADLAINVLISGLDANQSGLTPGSSYYLSGTAGAISTTPGTYRRFVGIAKSATELYFSPSQDPLLTGQDGSELYAADSVGTDSYAITLTPAIDAYRAGQMFRFKAGTANTGACSLAVNGLTAKTIKKSYNSGLATGDILAGQIVLVSFDSANDCFQMLSPSANTPLTSLDYLFGGDGSDGALAVSSGTTSIDCGSAKVLVKQYTSISITGTGKVNFINPHANGTIVIFKSQGDVTLTSNQTPMIDCSAMGGAGGVAGGSGAVSGNAAADTNAFTLFVSKGGGGGTNSGGSPVVGTAGPVVTAIAPRSFLTSVDKFLIKYGLQLWVGAGGGGGGSANASNNATQGTGGRGGGSLIIECGGALNFTTASGISVGGGVGTAPTNTTYGGAGGGGAGGMCLILYRTLTAASGTITVTGGAGGTNGTNANAVSGGSGATPYTAGTAGVAGTGTGPTGATGESLIAKNTDFF